MQTKAKKPNGKWKNSILWTLGSASPAICYMLISQLTYAMTESFAISAIYAGMIFLVSRILDGFTDIIAGMIIDRTHSKLGKGRVWDLCMVAAWIAAILCFSVPSGMTETMKLVYIFIMYNLYSSVFSTFVGCAEPIRMKNSMDEEGRLHAVSVAAVISTILSALVGIIIPVLIPVITPLKFGWTLIAVIIGLPSIIFTLLRFFLMPEIVDQEESVSSKKEDKIGFFESLKMLVNNRYTIIIFVVSLVRALVTAAGGSAGTYYFTYIYGDVAAASIPGMVSLVIFFAAALIPVLSEKFGNGKLCLYSTILGAAAYLLRCLMPLNLVWYTLCSAVLGLCSIPASYLLPVMLIDVMDFSKWKNGKTPEGIISASRTISDKLGQGLGSAATGIILQFGALSGGGYSDASIMFLNNIFPAICWIIGSIALVFYNLDKKMPQIRTELEARGSTN